MVGSETPAAPVAVLFLHSATQPPLGADTWVHGQIMRSLDRSSHVVHVACAKGRPGHRTPTYELVRAIPDLEITDVDLGPELSTRASLGGKLRSLVATVPAVVSFVRLTRYIRQHHIDLIHTSDRPRDAAAAVVLSRLTGAKCIIHAHVAFDDWMGRLLRWSMPRAGAMIAVSEFVKGSLVASGHPPATTHVVLNAIDATGWGPSGARAATRDELGVADGEPVVITVCRHDPAGVTR